VRTATSERPHPAGMGGIQKVYRFANGYGASVVRCPCSYGSGNGLWELAVVEFVGSGQYEFELTRSTPIADDVIGYLTEKRVDALLAEIEALPEKVKA
jgi:hypothetical protein